MKSNNPSPQLQIGDWYEVVSKANEDQLPIGALGIIDEFNEADNTVSILYGSTTYTVSKDNFIATWHYLEDGPALFQKHIADLMSELASDALEGVELNKQLTAFNPHIEPTKEASTTAVDVFHEQAVSVKENVNSFRVRVKKFQHNFADKQQRLKDLIEQQESMLEAKVDSMNALIEKAEEAIWTINLYLGTNEEIHQLVKGKSAPVEEKITIRQRVLYMDEESALAAEDGGIDCTTIVEFDKWIKDPLHLYQLLPETKGIIALKVRREAKDRSGISYAEQVELAKGDKTTYWLIRNGQNVYRIYTTLPVGDHIIALNDEFENFFKPKERWREETPKTLKPGSAEYMEAMKNVDEANAHYMRILLFMQGIIDRTHLFRPMKLDRINLLNEKHREEFIHYIYDAEDTRLLGVGKPSFTEWWKAANAKLIVGHRIVGTFHDYRYDYGKRGQDRVHPRGAPRPETNEIYTVESSFDGHLCVRYPYDKLQYNYYRDSDIPKKRASFRIHLSDEFLLDIDAVTVEEMEFYLQSRTDRSKYIQMFPLLKAAIAVKLAEVKEEAPFKQMLVGALMRDNGIDNEAAIVAVDELVKWYKFKTRVHRSLKKDDAKATRMILAEFMKRHDDATVRKAEYNWLVDYVVQQYPLCMFLGHKRGNTFTVFTPMSDKYQEKENRVFVCETILEVYSQSDIRVVEKREWRGTDGRRLRLSELYSTHLWKIWEHDAKVEQFLTDPEIEELKAALPGEFKLKANLKNNWNETCCYYLGIEITGRHSVEIWFHSQRTKVCTNLLVNGCKEPELHSLLVDWKKSSSKGFTYPLSYWPHQLSPTLRVNSFFSSKPRKKPAEVLLAQNEANIARYEADVDRFIKADIEKDKLNEIVEKYDDQFEAAVTEAYREHLHKEFIDEYRDEELWLIEKEQLLKHSDRVPGDKYFYRNMLNQAIGDHEPVVGITLSELMKQYHKGWKDKEDAEILKFVPKDFVLKEIDAAAE